MTLQVKLHHKTLYRYDRQVRLSPQEIRLRPSPQDKTKVLSYSLRVAPENHFLNWIQDPYGNLVGRAVFPEPTREFSLEVDMVVDMTALNPFDFFLEEEAAVFPPAYSQDLKKQLALYFEKNAGGKCFSRWMQGIGAENLSGNPIDAAIHLNRKIKDAIDYKIRLEPGVQTCDETLEKKSGSCRDMAWLLVETLRHLGLAARFVSGYLLQLRADIRPMHGLKGPPEDIGDLHAWAEVYLPGAGWVGLDATSGLLTGEGHIALARAATPAEASPIIGSLDACEVNFSFEITLQRILESPRPSRPYTDHQWREILETGRAIDTELKEGDVRLTMGGEPTFVHSEDRQGAEWHTAALGPTKKPLSSKLLRRLRACYAPGALVHTGQGKWYGGEPLPRWALGCYWRKDGEAVWENDSLLDDETTERKFGVTEAQVFLRKVAEGLGVDVRTLMPAHEDRLHALINERNLPKNIDLAKNAPKDSEERKQLRETLSQGLGTVVGYVLPLRSFWDGTSVRWTTGPWYFRDHRLFLSSGQSPMGYRLPLDSLPWENPEERFQETEIDPFAPKNPLPFFRKKARAALKGPASPAETEDLEAKNASIVRTALCVEPRDGHLYVFFPPTTTLEAYLDLVAAVEETARVLNMPVLLEGYAPPPDHRLQSLKVTPDPGVIEVNVHPSESWDDLVQKTEILYEEARQLDLTAEKFLVNGRPTGTGGGNHVTIGGPTAEDSPLLRRPDLLGSLLRYWQNHPSLSYLFSSLFMGPTSQAPRLDEARDDALYEATIALDQLDRMGQLDPSPQISPWTVDRLFRNVLIDVTGNTHRTEFCIDKLYSPDGPAGRLGLLELRAFEMPPHARMNLAQALLVRGLIARFWKEPYRRPLISWGNALHDRFLLPYFLERDFQDVLEDMRSAGYPFSMEWYAPFFEFRFPFIGSVTVRDVELELRHALEPWHVLGEEVGRTGTARFVDSCVERLEVRVKGAAAAKSGRYVITCNGRPLPLKNTDVSGEKGEQIAGVRFRAWSPPSALHPMLPVDAPLVFDVVDTWTGLSLGGCTYHVSHPGGRNYDLYPVNDREAASRCKERFEIGNQTPGPVALGFESANPLFPHTLDLRRRAVAADGFATQYDPQEPMTLAHSAGMTQYAVKQRI